MGVLVVQEFARQLGWSLKEDRRFNAKVAKGVSENQTVHLLFPQTYMNLSGTSVKLYADYYKIPLSHIVVIADDISLPFNQMKLKGMGSAGGHNGLKSIEQMFGTTHYIRLRMGIGHPGEQILADYVLEPFTQAEQKELAPFIARGAEVLHRLLKEDLSHVMKIINTVPRQKGAEPIDLTKPPVEGLGEEHDTKKRTSL